MTVSVALLGFAAVVMLLAPRLLVRGQWVRAAPRWGIVAWQASVGAVLGSFVLLAVAAALPVDRVSFDVGHLLHACGAVLRDHYAVHKAAWVAAASVTAAVLALSFLAGAILVRAGRVARSRARQRSLIDLVAYDVDRCGAHVLAHDEPLAYCIPGRRGRIVLTTAAKSALGEAELAAVIAHERAHLRGRHDLVLFGADVARGAFPWLPFFRVAKEQTASLVEMLADDRAAKSTGRLPLASALLDLSAQGVPRGALGASGQLTVERVLRLVDELRQPSYVHRAVVLMLSAVLISAPWVIAVAPVWAAQAGRCSIPPL